MDINEKLYKQWIRRHICVANAYDEQFGMAYGRVTMDGCYVTSLFRDQHVEDDKHVRWLYDRGVEHVYAPCHFSNVFDSDVACVGFCEEKQTYIGWSHRAWNEFGIGHVSEPGACECSSGYIPGYLEEHPEMDFRVKPGFVCETLDDCKRVAFAYAESVG